MDLFIKKLILWPKDSTFGPRTLTFERGKINLITGRSRTGKSSVTYIIDYVLGSGKCAIPVGEIRTTVAWYGLLLETDGVRMLVAREEPGERVQSTNYFIDERETVTVPNELEKNSNLESFKRLMDRRAGLPMVDFDFERTGDGFKGRPSFRDLAAFNFQPQHIVANPYTLFYKADTSEHRQKLATIFPFVLGAVTVQTLEREHEREQLRRELRRLQAQRARRERAAETWLAEAMGMHARAQELGLLPGTTSGPPPTLDACVRDLESIPETLAKSGLPVLSPGATEAAVRRLQVVRDQEHSVDAELVRLRTRLRRMVSLEDSLGSFSIAVDEQAGRLSGIGWFARKFGDSACPVCGTDDDSAQQQLRRLEQASTVLAERQQSAKEVPAALQGEVAEVSEEIAARETRLQRLRTERAELERERAEGGGQSLDEVYRFVGRIEQSIRNIQESGGGSDLQAKIDDAQRRIQVLERLLDPGQQRARLQTALRRLAGRVRRHARFMNLERHSDEIEFRVKDLTLVFRNLHSSRSDYLWEIGSGENWMGYHISTLLALHALLLDRESSPVPTFLVVDQPSQVYFPSGSTDGASNRDIEATRKIFETLEQGLLATNDRLQVIVSEHADLDTLGDLRTLHLVEDWHREDVDYLIPRAWLGQEAP